MNNTLLSVVVWIGAVSAITAIVVTSNNSVSELSDEAKEVIGHLEDGHSLQETTELMGYNCKKMAGQHDTIIMECHYPPNESGEGAYEAE